jgi:hypothetical protein
LRGPSFWAALLLVIATLFLMFAVYTDLLQLHITVGPYLIHHWLSWIGAIFIAVFTPIYYSLKRKNPKGMKTLLGVHVFGNMLSFMFISIHFTQQISRPAQFYPDLGTGIVLYAAMILLVATGFFMRFQIVNKARNALRFLHTSSTVTFYLIILVHILHGVGLIN